ncbi:MAG: hypothetical protein PHP08_04640 [Candidatus Dojkabacteria bacterium]|nr:hypothetical protein [Candidatus Dojkabacteria bacterium]
MKKLVIYTTIGTILVVSGVLVTGKVNAQELRLGNDTFTSKLAEKLGVDDEEVATVIEDVREEMQAERQAERDEAIIEALDNGDLTEKQAEILNAMEDIDIDRGKPEDWEEWKDYTPEQREALRDARDEIRQQEIIDALYEQGLEVTSDELDELKDVLQELGIGMYGYMGEGGGMQMRQGSDN